MHTDKDKCVLFLIATMVLLFFVLNKETRLKFNRVALGGLMIIVLVIGPKGRGFRLGRGRWIFKGDRNPQHDFLRREVKPSVPCKILRHAEDPCGV
jgi:hypothetical protein